MISFRQAEMLIVDGLQEWLKNKGHECLVVMANQTAPMPSHPYMSYTVTTPLTSDAKGYSIAEDGTRYKPFVQVWSFTVQARDDVQALEIAMLAYDWFALAGNTYLSDNGIVAQRVGNIANRDNLLTIEYEYRRGFDVQFLLVNTLTGNDCETAGYIDTADIQAIKEV